MMPPALRPGDGKRQDAGEVDEPRWCRLWRELARARRELRDARAIATEVEARFATTIEPRERALTGKVVRITERLIDHYIDHYANDDLDFAERSLLGLWIEENLEALERHPFADLDSVQSSSLRWRRAIAPERLRPVREFDGGSGDEPGSGNGGRPAPEDATGAHRDRSSSEATSGAARATDPDDAARRDFDDTTARAVIDRLFRKLAQALHPDREPDATRRRAKQVQMGDALAARRSRDLDALLSLYAEHVGDPSGSVDGIDAPALIAALERQLAGMRLALRRIRVADSFRDGLLERYAGRDARERERRIARHAQAIDAELARLERLHASIADRAGLADALLERRALHLDRMEIAGLTGG